MRDELFHTSLSRQWQLQYKEIHHQWNTYEREGLLIWCQEHQIEINSLSVTFWCATHIGQSSTAGRAQGEGTGDGKEVSAALTCVTGCFWGLAMLGGKGQFGHAEPKLSSCLASAQQKCSCTLLYPSHKSKNCAVSHSCSLASCGTFTPTQAIDGWILAHIHVLAKWPRAQATLELCHQWVWCSKEYIQRIRRLFQILLKWCTTDLLNAYRSFLNTCNTYPECLLKNGPSTEVPNTEQQLFMGSLCSWLLPTSLWATVARDSSSLTNFHNFIKLKDNYVKC